MSRAGVRGSMWAGVGFVLLFVTGVFVTFGNSPDIASSDSDSAAAAKYVSFLSSSGQRTGVLVGAYTLMVAALLFVWFVHGLRTRLPLGAGSQLLVPLAVLGAGAMMAAAMASAAWPGSVTFGGQPVPADGDTVVAVMNLFFPFLFVVFALVSSVIIGILSAGGRSAGLPVWLCYAGWLGVLGGLFAVIFLPMVLPLLWYLAVGIAMLASPAPAAVEEVPVRA